MKITFSFFTAKFALETLFINDVMKSQPAMCHI